MHIVVNEFRPCDRRPLGCWVWVPACVRLISEAGGPGAATGQSTGVLTNYAVIQLTLAQITLVGWPDRRCGQGGPVLCTRCFLNTLTRPCRVWWALVPAFMRPGIPLANSAKYVQANVLWEASDCVCCSKTSSDLAIGGRLGTEHRCLHAFNLGGRWPGRCSRAIDWRVA